jgi:protein-S-isoprenylcysteine O-methyltransferase Ste14
VLLLLLHPQHPHEQTQHLRPWMWRLGAVAAALLLLLLLLHAWR